jgi:hypothetical protein
MAPIPRFVKGEPLTASADLDRLFGDRLEVGPEHSLVSITRVRPMPVNSLIVPGTTCWADLRQMHQVAIPWKTTPPWRPLVSLMCLVRLATRARSRARKRLN